MHPAVAAFSNYDAANIIEKEAGLEYFSAYVGLAQLLIMKTLYDTIYGPTNFEVI